MTHTSIIATRMKACLVIVGLGLSARVAGQTTPKYQTDVSAEELRARRARVLDAIGAEAFALVQGAPAAPGFVVFRQSNELYYLTGLEVPHSYLLLDGRRQENTRRTTATTRATWPACGP